MKPRSVGELGSTWPAFPAATATQRPRVVSALSIHRAIALDVSWACPFVPRLMLIDSGSGVPLPSLAARSSRYSTASAMRVES
jgi:hypothetical protein